MSCANDITGDMIRTNKIILSHCFVFNSMNIIKTSNLIGLEVAELEEDDLHLWFKIHTPLIANSIQQPSLFRVGLHNDKRLGVCRKGVL